MEKFELAYDVELNAVVRVTVTAATLAEAEQTALAAIRDISSEDIDKEISPGVRITECTSYAPSLYADWGMEKRKPPQLFEINGEETS